jgi:hydrogenase nickel incorporation protein HypA/HybF
MHEYGLCVEIVDTVLSTAREHEAKEVKGVSLEVGVLRGIVLDHLRFFFEHLTKGTLAEGADLSLEEEPVEVDCPACGVSTFPGMTLTCPGCGSSMVAIRGGDSIRIASVELET